jgi:ABC-type nitrate/sulfonate/bicarbonate transport system substrate-binding protein
MKLLAALVALAALLVACSPAAQPQRIPTPTVVAIAPTAGATTKVSIAYSNLIADSLTLWMAKETGIFAKTG